MVWNEEYKNTYVHLSKVKLGYYEQLKNGQIFRYNREAFNAKANISADMQLYNRVWLYVLIPSRKNPIHKFSIKSCLINNYEWDFRTMSPRKYFCTLFSSFLTKKWRAWNKCFYLSVNKGKFVFQSNGTLFGTEIVCIEYGM